MKLSDIGLMLTCAALWGASFMFVRISATEFGAIALAGARVAGAALILLPMVVMCGAWRDLFKHWRAIALSGIISAAIPLVLFAFAAQTITAGLMSILNAVTPLFATLVAWVWLGQGLTRIRSVGSVLGFGGVLWLAWGQVGFKTGSDGAMAGWAMIAAVTGSALYGFSANYTRERLSGVAPIAVAAGGQFIAALILAIPAAVFWPAVSPSARAWAALATLAILCTALAYVLYFKLIASVGATRATTVSYLIPGFGVTWGALFLGEAFDADMALGCAVILCGTALATGIWPRRQPEALNRPKQILAPPAKPRYETFS